MNLRLPGRANLNNPFAALRHPNFRYYSIGMMVSMTGTWMQNIAQPWLAYTLTHSPFLLSLIGALQFIPLLLFSLFAGVIIDKYPKKNILILTQSASLVITLFLAILVWTDQIRYWHILVLATLVGFVNTLDIPARQSFVIEMVGKDDLMNAIALNSTVSNLSRVIGPALAGLLMAYVGIAACFFINAFSFAAVLVSLFFIKPLNVIRVIQPVIKMTAAIKEGVRYILDRKILKDTLLTIAIVSTFAMNYNVLVPVFAQEVLNQGETGFGFLMSFMGIGSLLGAFFIASNSRSGPKRYILTVFPFCVGGFLVMNGLTGTFAFAAIFLMLSGFCFVAFASNANSILQLNSSDQYRGRVMSIYSLIFAGSTPLGNLYAGAIAEKVSAAAGFIACGAIILVLMVVLLFYFRKTNIR